MAKASFSTDFLILAGLKRNSTKYNIEVEVAARPDAIDNNEGVYALDEACKIMDYFSDYFQVEYPLAKSS